MKQIEPAGAVDHPLHRLDIPDLDMVAAFVLESGSIKALARRYDVSYPTMRGRLDALIDRLSAAMTGTPSERLIDYLATLIEEGRVAPDVARTIRDLHAEAMSRVEAGPARGADVLPLARP